MAKETEKQDRLRKMKALGEMLENDDCRTLALNALKEALGAYRSFGTGQGSYETEPDYKTRVQAATVLLAYTDGKPVERIITITHEQGKMSEEDHAEAIARALRLPPGKGIALLKAKAKSNGQTS